MSLGRPGFCGSAGTRPGISWSGLSSEDCWRRRSGSVLGLGVDEKSVGKGHTYMTLVCDLDASTVEYIAEDRKQTSLDGYFQGLSQEQRGRH